MRPDLFSTVQKKLAKLPLWAPHLILPGTCTGVWVSVVAQRKSSWAAAVGWWYTTSEILLGFSGVTHNLCGTFLVWHIGSVNLCGRPAEIAVSFPHPRETQIKGLNKNLLSAKLFQPHVLISIWSTGLKLKCCEGEDVSFFHNPQLSPFSVS